MAWPVYQETDVLVGCKAGDRGGEQDEDGEKCEDDPDHKGGRSQVHPCIVGEEGHHHRCTRHSRQVDNSVVEYKGRGVSTESPHGEIKGRCQ